MKIALDSVSISVSAVSEAINHCFDIDELFALVMHLKALYKLLRAKSQSQASLMPSTYY